MIVNGAEHNWAFEIGGQKILGRKFSTFLCRKEKFLKKKFTTFYPLEVKNPITPPTSHLIHRMHLLLKELIFQNYEDGACR